MPLRRLIRLLPVHRHPELRRRGRVPFLAILLGTLLLGAVPGGPAGAFYDEIGGDDVRVATLELFPGTAPVMDIAENGDIYVAAAVDLASGTAIHVYRSQDGGDHWSLWAEIDSTDVDYNEPSLHIAEGTEEWLYIACIYQGPSEARPQIRVLRSPLAAPSWTVHAVMTSGTNDFSAPCLTSDEVSFASYYLYLAAEADDGNGCDIWFARSTTYGSTWETPYEIATLGTGDHYRDPFLCYGSSGVVHCVWTYLPAANDATYDEATCYRRATTYAGLLSDWGVFTYLSSRSDGLEDREATVAASHGGNRVVAAWKVVEDFTLVGTDFRSSSDAGVSWSAPERLAGMHGCELMTLPGSAGFSLYGSRPTTQLGFRTAADADPISWSVHRTLVDGHYWHQWGSNVGRRQDYDPTRGNRRGGIAWAGSSGAPDTIYFDAEWRRDPGYANLEPGFPLSLAYSVVAPPAVCELDGDPESEIVFGDAAGRIVALSHDGKNLPGWPIDIGTFQMDATVAVGDIDGDGRSDVVAGNSTGYVHAFDRAGAALAGWPCNTGTSQPAYVALGGITTEQRQVAVCSGSRLVLYNGDGTVVPGFPVTVAGPIAAAPAIGDVDGDGDREIVILQQQYMNVFRGNGTVQAYRNLVSAGQTFSNAPTLGDLNLDGDLEIVAPTDQGRLYVMNPDGTDYPGGWPYVDPAGQRLTSVAMAQFRGTMEPELIFGVEDAAAPEVHAFYHDMTELGGFPRPTGAGWYLYAMPIVDVLDNGSPDVVVASRAKEAYAWDNYGSSLPGWPESLGATCYVSAASGDIDSDGNVEVVVATHTPAQLHVYDLGATVYRDFYNQTRWWPMYGYNALRQGCLACDEDRVTGVPGGAAAPRTLTFAAPVPNPTTGSVAVSFELPEAAAVRLDLFDAQGRRVAALLKEEMGAGTHRRSWELRSLGGGELASGVYYVRLAVNGPRTSRELTRRIVLVR